MNYYDEIDSQIKEYLEKEDYLEAYRIIKNELNVPYIPKDFNEKLINYLEYIKPNISISKKEMSIETICEYLDKDCEYQLMAVSELLKYDLRKYLDLINKYLSKEGYKEAKVLLIDELIRQEINEEIKMIDQGIIYTFIPKYLLLPQDSDGYIKADLLLKDKYLKDPSKYELSKQLLYKEVLMSLPINYEEDEGERLANKVIDYIEDAFK